MACYRSLQEFSGQFKAFGYRHPAIFTEDWIGNFHLGSTDGTEGESPVYRHALPVYIPANGTSAATILTITDKGALSFPASPSDGVAPRRTSGDYHYVLGVPVGSQIETMNIDLEEHRDRSGKQTAPTTLAYEAHLDRELGKPGPPLPGTPVTDTAAVARAAAAELNTTWDSWAKSIEGYFKTGDTAPGRQLPPAPRESRSAWLVRRIQGAVSGHTAPGPRLESPPPTQAELDESLPDFQNELHDALAPCKESEWARDTVSDFERRISSNLPRMAAALATSPGRAAGQARGAGPKSATAAP